MAMSKILGDRRGYATLEMMTSAKIVSDYVRAVNCEVSGRVAGVEGDDGLVNGSGKMASKKRRRRRSLASRNLDEMELQMLRQKINGRERQRMHDLNSALDGLREVGGFYKRCQLVLSTLVIDLSFITFAKKE